MILILLNNAEVSRKLEKEFRDKLYNIELEIGEPISTFGFSKLDWEGKHKYTHFISILNEMELN